MMLFKIVDFPAPFGPISVTMVRVGCSWRCRTGSVFRGIRRLNCLLSGSSAWALLSDYSYQRFTLFIIMAITTGAPNTAVTELMESSVGENNVLASRSLNRQNTAPPRKHPGITTMGFAVLNSCLNHMGTAIPTKETGPAKAVTVAERTLDNRISSIRNRLILTPMFLA